MDNTSMLQVYLVRHGETKWNKEKRIQGQSDSPLTEKGRNQARKVGKRVSSFGITHVITSDLGRSCRTAEIIAKSCSCNLSLDKRLRELNMGILERRYVDSLTAEEEGWRRALIDGTKNGRIPDGESMFELSERMHAALSSCLQLPKGSCPLLVSHAIALGCLMNTILGLPAWAEPRIRLRNCSISRINYQNNRWLGLGWIVDIAGDVSHLETTKKKENY